MSDARTIAALGAAFSETLKAALPPPPRELAVDRVRREYFQDRITLLSLDIELGALPAGAWAEWLAAQEVTACR